MREKEKEVTALYHRLWPEIKQVHIDSIVEQLLYNVDLPPHWFANKRCLDVGCGAGHAVLALRQLGAECYACDLGCLSLFEAANRWPEIGNALINATVLSLPYSSNSFDFVYCNGVLHHTIDARKGFSELVRVTKQGGILFISVYGVGGLYDLGLQIGRLLANAIPLELSVWIIAILLGQRTVPNSYMPAKVSMLDNLYVSIRNRYSEAKIVGWFEESDMCDISRTKTTIYDHQKPINRFIHGEGYLQIRGKKSRTGQLK